MASFQTYPELCKKTEDSEYARSPSKTATRKPARALRQMPPEFLQQRLMQLHLRSGQPQLSRHPNITCLNGPCPAALQGTRKTLKWMPRGSRANTNKSYKKPFLDIILELGGSSSSHNDEFTLLVLVARGENDNDPSK